MPKQKNIKLRGKISLSRYFQEFKKGDKVAIVGDPSFPQPFPQRIWGRTGIVDSQRGSAYLVRIIVGGTEKIQIIKPIHLKKLE